MFVACRPVANVANDRLNRGASRGWKTGDGDSKTPHLNNTKPGRAYFYERNLRSTTNPARLRVVTTNL